MEWFGNTIAVTMHELTRSDDGEAVMSRAAYDWHVRQKNVHVLQRGCRCRKALVEYCSLPERFRVRFEAKYGDPERIMKQREIALPADLAARRYFAGIDKDAFRLPNGACLPERKQAEYTLNAQVLNALRGMLDTQKAMRRAYGNRTPVIWSNIFAAAEQMREAYGHTLPKSEARLRDKLRQYAREGYACLVSGKFCNTNTLKITKAAGRQIDHTEVPLLFAGAESLKQASRTAAWYLTRDGVQKSRNAARTEAVTMSNGGMLFSRIGSDGVETESMSLSPTVYTPSAGSTAFGNTELIGTPGGTATVTIPGGTHDMRGEANIDMHSGSKEIAWGDYFIWGNTFEIGEHTTLRIPATIFTLELTLHFQEWVYSPEDDRDILRDSVLEPSPSQHFRLSLYRLSGDVDERVIYEVFDAADPVIRMPAQMLTDLPAGNYRFLLFSEGDISFDPPVSSAFTGVLEAFLTVPSTTVSASWSGGLCRSKIFGNGWLFSKTTNQYCGIIGDDNRFIFEQRCGTQGMRFDEKGLSFFLPDNTWGNYGVLCGYQVDANGVFQARFGMKDNRDSNCVRTATGKYTFNHYIGHDQYTAAIVLTSGTHEIFVINGIAANSVNIEFRNSAGVMKNRSFMITFYGKY